MSVAAASGRGQTPWMGGTLWAWMLCGLLSGEPTGGGGGNGGGGRIGVGLFGGLGRVKSAA